MAWIKSIFWNAEEHRLRFLWRFLVFVALFGLMLALLQTALDYLLPGLSGAVLGSEADARFLKGEAINEWLMLAALFVTLLVIGEWIDRRPLSDYGFRLGRRWLLDFLFGLTLGALLMTGIFLTEYAMGWVQVIGVFGRPAGMTFPVAILWAMGLFIAVGIFEEWLSRGYLLHNLSETLNFRFLNPFVALAAAWIISSGLFGLAHAGNPNATVISTINIIVAGLFLGLGYILTGDLAISIGVHMTWNFFQGNVFGFPVSGTPTNGVSFITTAQKDPEAWTGGAFGPEAGLVGLIAIGIGVALALAWVKWRYGRVQLQLSLPRPPQEKTSEAAMVPDVGG